MNILIVDDDSIDRMSAIRTLKKSDLPIKNIDQVDNAEQAIQLASENHYDVILLDYQIPPVNGIEILREIRGLNDFSTAIIMLSHSHDENLALSCIEAGAQDFIMKSEVTSIRLKRAILISSERHILHKELKETHNQLKTIAERDSLTGLKNRYFFDDAMKIAIQKTSRTTNQLVLILLDLDNFKNINDLMGHQAGDQFLEMIARRLERPIRDSDQLCRLGGDEFAILVYDLPNLEQIRVLTDRIYKSLEEPIKVGGESIEVKVSMGVAAYPQCAKNAMELMKCADVAMYRAKDLGRNQVQYYSREFHLKMESRVRLEGELKIAFKEDQFLLFYQPQIDSSTNLLVGVEALIRWEHPTLGLVPPDQFIPIAEESDLIIEIGRWVIETACKQYSQWLLSNSLKNLSFTISINLSARQLKDSGLNLFVESCLQKYEVPAHSLELELTESCLENSLSAIDMLNELSKIGVRLALDDFGTGYSSLSYLRQFPFSILKVDKSFVQSTDDDEKQATLLAAVCAFAHSLEYETVAEGVETEQQKELCKSLNVKRLQGYLFSKPLPPEKFEAGWLD